MQKPKALFNWSGGKDSSLCLYKLLQTGQYDISCLLTSVNEKQGRISMHGVRNELLEQQATSIGLPLFKLELPEMPSMQVYETIMADTLKEFKEKGVSHSIFGDIFLEDLRQYRENKLMQIGMQAVFPLWNLPTGELVKEFINLGFKAVTVCVNEKFLDKSFVGRTIDAKLLADLPSNVDPCGEHGEFHSFVYDGPIFKQPIEFEKGDVVYRKYEAPTTSSNDYNCGDQGKKISPDQYGFWFNDLLPRI